MIASSREHNLAITQRSDFRSTTIPRMVELLAAEISERPAFTDASRTMNFGALRHEARALAKSLYADGVRPGHAVGVLMGNVNEWVVACLATQYLGAAMVAVNTWYTARELAYVLGHAEISVLIMTQQFLRYDYCNMLESMRPWEIGIPNLRTVVVLGETSRVGMISYSSFLEQNKEVDEAVIDAIVASIDEDDIAFLLYTSGSTSKPKGVRLLHRGLIGNCFGIGERQHLDQHDVLLLPISLFWGYGCSNALFAALTHGVHVVLQEHFSAPETLMLAELHRCTAIYLTPNMAQSLLDDPGLPARDLESLRKGLTWGPPALMQSVFLSLAPDICQIFGFTEGYGNSAVTDILDPLEKRLTTSGRVLPGSEMRIVDPITNAILEPGKIGEIRIRGFVFDGYHRAPELTRDAFDNDDFFCTGDLGTMDKDGFLQFRGRIKEIIRTGGMNVSPLEVEDVLRTHPAIEDVYVIGLPDAKREEVVAAIAILREGFIEDPEALTEHCRQNLSAYKVPKHYHFTRLDRIPLTATRKVHRMRLIEFFGLELS